MTDVTTTVEGYPLARLRAPHSVRELLIRVNPGGTLSIGSVWEDQAVSDVRNWTAVQVRQLRHAIDALEHLQARVTGTTGDPVLDELVQEAQRPLTRDPDDGDPYAYPDEQSVLAATYEGDTAYQCGACGAWHADEAYREGWLRSECLEDRYEAEEEAAREREEELRRDREFDRW